MYNGFNQQFIGGGPGFNTWPPAGPVAPGNPQAGGMSSFPHPYGAFPGNPGMMGPGPGMPFGMMPPQQAGWHAMAAQQQFQQQQQHQYNMQQQQQQHMYHQQQQQQQQMGYDYQGQTAYGSAPPQGPLATGSADDAPPPLPDGEPPPLPPPSYEDPPPLPPPDASGSAPPLPPGPGPLQQPQNQGVNATNTIPQATTPRPGASQAAAAAPQGAWPGHSYPQALNWSGPGTIHAHPHEYPPPYGMQYDPYMAPYGTVQPAPAGPYAPAAAPSQPPQVAGPPAGGSASGGPTPAPQPLEAPVVDITRLLRPPHRASRPRKLLLLLRGLPGSGKSTLARKIREAEAEAGAEAPRVHSMDDYYMQEVEVEVAEEDASGRKKRRKVTEMKYVYEPEMEGAYFRELVRAVGRSVEDRRHSFVVVDAPLLRLEQLRELLAVGQRANFSCLVLRPLETDPAVCASPGRNVHGHSPEALRAMAAQYEEAPPLYEQVSAVSLFGGPVVGEAKAAGADGGDGAGGGGGGDGGDGITEVDMDAEDDDSGDAADGDGDAAAAAGGTSRWGAADGSDDGTGGRGERKKKKRKRMQAAVELVDDEGILSGLRDALGGCSRGQGGGEGQADGSGAAAAANGSTGHGVKRRASQPTLAAVGPLKSALRRVSSEPVVVAAGGGGGGEAATPQGAGAGRERRRVWWPDLGPTGEAKEEEEDGNASAGADTPGNAPQPSPLVDVVVLEGLGPPPELEDLPYGYQRKTLAAPGPRRPDQGQGAVGLVVQQAGGAGAAAAGAAGGHGSLSAADHHVHFREQAKAEHESEHDLFRHLLLGKRPHGAGAGQDGWGPPADGAAGTGTGGTPLGLFARAADPDEEEDT